MIEQTAMVTALAGDMATVRVMRESSCGQCQTQKVCGTHALSRVLGNKFVEVKALNPVDAKPGDMVAIGLAEQVLLKSAMLVYLLPLLMLFACAITGQYISIKLGAADAAPSVAMLAGFVGLLTAFYKVRRFMRDKQKDEFYQPVILRKLNRMSADTKQSMLVNFNEG